MKHRLHLRWEASCGLLRVKKFDSAEQLYLPASQAQLSTVIAAQDAASCAASCLGPKEGKRGHKAYSKASPRGRNAKGLWKLRKRKQGKHRQASYTQAQEEAGKLHEE